MKPVEISTREEYDVCRQAGIEPLLDARIRMAHALRVEVQREKFGRGNHEENNLKFYRWMWEHKPHICEECMRPLGEYSASFISHIESRGNGPQMAYDPRNVNVLCFKHHNQWENGDRKRMRIWRRNTMTIEELRKEYNED